MTMLRLRSGLIDPGNDVMNVGPGMIQLCLLTIISNVVIVVGQVMQNKTCTLLNKYNKYWQWS
ncbi:MAG: hypothetical protein DBY35_08590 [Bacteroidales bacterium]|nr:MAG: hypothetical protein DBY35_08590 [Bacteroidales bacterium]